MAYTVEALSKQCLADSTKWFGDTSSGGSQVEQLAHHTLALAGEVGEFANIVKKVQRGSLSMEDLGTQLDLADELADVFIYLLNIAALLEINLESEYHIKRGINDQRFTKERQERKANNG